MEGLKLYFSRSIFCLRRDVQSQDRNEKGISQIPRRMFLDASFVQRHHCLDWPGIYYAVCSSACLIRSLFNQDSGCSLLGDESELNSAKLRNSNDILTFHSHFVFNLFHDLWRRLTESEKKDVVSSTRFRVDLINQKAFVIHKNIYHEIRYKRKASQAKIWHKPNPIDWNREKLCANQHCGFHHVF